ncbi:UrcA family protein [Sphingomonas sp. S2-65]|uniref:UrcA family protein n=1 Tax=Sphingomonas sp. S2-65 TaxID=2903960 RepID=UPI001F326841|nr:UrcA family protein [Sphingomonas sp. S2-65]UYY58419.1 UrcA family protein [Sphingomonas sp. S2-65]
MRTVAGLTAAFVAATMAAGVAAAKPVDSSHEAHIVVRTNDLDLTTRHGQKRLDRRIRAAAAAVCPAADIVHPLSPTMACRREAYRSAVVQRDRVIAKAVRVCNAVRPPYAGEPSRTNQGRGETIGEEFGPPVG